MRLLVVRACEPVNALSGRADRLQLAQEFIHSPEPRHEIVGREIPMSALGHKLMIKYGLVSEPAIDAIARWMQGTEAYISAGIPPEVSGARAAKDVFPDCGRMTYLSEADTILALLAEAKGRHGPSGR